MNEPFGQWYDFVSINLVHRMTEFNLLIDVKKLSINIDELMQLNYLRPKGSFTQT